MYSSLGISRARGLLALVRPDGYVGTVAPLDNPTHLAKYLDKFMHIMQ